MAQPQVLGWRGLGLSSPLDRNGQASPLGAHDFAVRPLAQCRGSGEVNFRWVNLPLHLQIVVGGTSSA